MAEPVGHLRLRITPGSIARATLLVAGWMVVVAVLTRARGSLVLFALGLTGAALALPLVSFLGRWMPRWVAVVAVSLLAAAAVGFVGYRAVDEVDRQTDKLADAIDESVSKIEASPRYADLADRLDLKDRAQQVTTTLREDVSLNADRLSELAPALASGAGDVFIVWLFSVMLLAAGPPLVESVVRLFPSAVTRARVHTGDRARPSPDRPVRGAGAAACAGGVPAGHGRSRPARPPCPHRAGPDHRLPEPVPLLRAVRGRRAVRGVDRAALAGPGRPRSSGSPSCSRPVDVVFVQHRIDRWSVAVRSFLLVVATMLGWELEGVRGVIIATVAITFLIAAVDEGLAIRDGTTDDPGSGLDGQVRRSTSPPVPSIAQ